MLQIKPNRWSCLPTAFAIALQRPVAELIKRIGHDGSEILWPDLPEPRCRRGFHTQELVSVAWNLGFSCTAIECCPSLTPDGKRLARVEFSASRVDEFLKSTSGVVTGAGKRCHHAVAYHHGCIYDPDGKIYPHTEMAAEHFLPHKLFITHRKGD